MSNEQLGFCEGVDVERAVAESLPKNLIAAHPVQDSLADEGSRGTCSPASPCAQRYETGKPEGCKDVVSLGSETKDLD